MNPVETARAIASLDAGKVLAAAAQVGHKTTRKADAVAALIQAERQGLITLAQIMGAAPQLTGTIQPPVPAFPHNPAQEVIAAAASRAESVALEANTKADKVSETMTMVGEALAEVLVKVEDLTREAQALRQIKADPAAVASAIRAEVEQAFGPIRAAAETSSPVKEAVVSAVASAPIARVTVAQAFGVEVADIKGNSLMVDIYDHPAAPAVDPCFIWTADILRQLVCAADTGANVWFGGEKGTGKTQTAEQFAARTGRAFNRVNFRKYSTAEQFVGATGLEQGATVFKLGEFTETFCNVPGSVNLLDEPTNTDPGEMAQFNALLEPAGRVNLGGVVRTRAPGALVFAADNTMGSGDVSGRYAGTRVQNSALLDRFSLKVPFTFLPLAQEIEAVVKHTGCTNTLAAQVMKVILTARAKVQTGDVVDAPSIRQVVAWIRAMPYLGVRRAWEVTIAASQPPESAVAMEAIYVAEVNESVMLSELN